MTEILDKPRQADDTTQSIATDEMVSAGARVLCDVFGLCERISAEGIAEEVYEAMVSASLSPRA